MEGMNISFAGEAYETFQGVVRELTGYGVDITLNGETFAAILFGPDEKAEDGATVQFIRVVDEDYRLSSYPFGSIESAVVENIKVA